MAQPPALARDERPYELHRGRHILATEVPEDAPELVVRWHFATDVPKRRQYADKPSAATTSKPKLPTQFTPFSAADSRAIEDAYLTSKTAADDEHLPRIPVNEDHLFEVNIPDRELGAIYWQGPVYEIRRGTWHFADGSSLKPCDEVLATQVEDGYLKIKPYRTGNEMTRVSQDAQKAFSSGDQLADVSKDSRLVASSEVKATGADLARRKSLIEGKTGIDQPKDHMRPLFGAYAGKYVLYTSPSTAWLLSNDLYGKISSSFFQSITRGVHMGGQKLKRGFSDAEQRKAAAAAAQAAEEAQQKKEEQQEPLTESLEQASSAKEADAGTGKPSAVSGEYEQGDDPDRKITHLILCCHGIGQKLGERMESVNFVHDINVLRRSIKKSFKHSRDLQALASDKNNCGVQVLPVQWRQAIKFGMARDYAEDEQDISNTTEHEEVPTLQDITVEGVQTIRNIVSDVLLDILLYYQPAYREQIVRAVSGEMNRIYRLFKSYHPDFNGKISILGHSLGSAIAFDILCRQPVDEGMHKIPKEVHMVEKRLALDFPVENFYAVGSPIGLFQMLRGKTIAGRELLREAPQEGTPFSPLGPIHDPLETASYSAYAQAAHEAGHVPSSYPKCRNMYNIFHPSDPVSYRIEPLVSKHAAKLKPYPLPYTKAGFRQQLVGLSSIPQRAYEGASSYWSAIRSSVTNSIVSRSLGYGGMDDKSSVPQQQNQSSQTQQLNIAVPGTSAGQETLYAAFERTYGASSPSRPAQADSSRDPKASASGDAKANRFRYTGGCLWLFIRVGNLCTSSVLV
ncbi:hypothetical protein PYCC9005_001474 [Savitreella phatthalungensis]